MYHKFGARPYVAYHILSTASHTKKLQCRRGIPRTYWRTDLQAVGLPSLHGWERPTPVVLLLRRSAGSRIQLQTGCVVSVYSTFFSVISFFSVFRPSLVASVFFLNSVPLTFPAVCLATCIINFLTMSSHPKASRTSYLCPSEVRIFYSSFLAAQGWVRICKRRHRCQRIEFLSSVIYPVTGSVTHCNFSTMLNLRYK